MSIRVLAATRTDIELRRLALEALGIRDIVMYDVLNHLELALQGLEATIKSHPANRGK